MEATGETGAGELNPVFPAYVNDRSQVIIRDRESFDNYAKTLRGSELEVIIRKRKSQRSSQQNRYYFGVVVTLIGDYCGYDADDMHEALAMKFLRIEDCPITGSPRRKRTPKTNTKEFADYVDQCIRFGAELGVVIPEPGMVEIG